MLKTSKLAAGLAIAATAALGGASIALADGYSKAPTVAYERPADWSGFYFGLSSGWQWSRVDTHFDVGSNFDVNYDTGNVGGHIGLQHQFGLVVLGVEANWISTFRDERGTTTCPNPTFNCSQQLNDMLTIGGRAGWAAGHWMPYITGGYASARTEYRAVTAVPGSVASTTLDQGSVRHGGWYVGGGFEWVVSPGWTTGLEYRHYEFDRAHEIAFTPTGGTILGDNNSADASADTIMARVSWRWGREPAAAPLK